MKKKCFPWVGLRISFLYIFCSSSTTDNALFTFLFFYFLEKMSILYFWEISFLLYPPSLHSSPPPVCLQAFLRILVSSKLYWRWWKGLLVVKLLFRGYFLIDASDKVDVGYSMQMREVFLPGNFLLLSLPPSPPFPCPGTPQDINCLDFVSILGWVKFLKHIYLFGFGLSKLFPSPILLRPQTPHN